MCVCMMGGLCCFYGTGCRPAAMAAPLASSSLARSAVVFYSYGTSLLEGGGRGCTDLEQYTLMATL